MIVEYELALAKYVAEMDPLITAIYFTNDFLTESDVAAVAKYPICFIQRDLNKFIIGSKSIDLEVERGVAKVFPSIVQYRLRIWQETAIKTLEYVKKLRMQIENKPYLSLTVDNEPISIGMRFIYSGMEEVRQEDHRKGALRSADAIWESTIVIDNTTEFKLIEMVTVSLNGLTVQFN